MVFQKVIMVRCILVMGLTLVGLNAVAQEIYKNETVFSRAPTVEELNTIFSKVGGKNIKGSKNTGPKTRSIVLEAAPAASQASTPPPSLASPAKENQTVSLRIQFDIDSAEIKPEFETALSSFAEFMQDNPDARFEIGGHADASGSKEHNNELSYNRAERSLRFLVSVYGIDPERLKAIGYGETSPLPGLNSNDSRNRRVSFFML